MKNYIYFLIGCFVTICSFSACDDNGMGVPLATQINVQSSSFDLTVVPTETADTTLATVRWVDINSKYTLKFSNSTNDSTVTFADSSTTVVNEDYTIRELPFTDTQLVYYMGKMGLSMDDDATLTLKILGTKSDGVADSAAVSFSLSVLGVDDIVQDGVDYITLNNSKGQQQLTYTQDADNKYQYEIKTTGNDPFIFTDLLTADLPGDVLKFRYKAANAFYLEIFWCNKEDGWAGSHGSTRVLIPAATKWTTFTHDYTDAMKSNGFVGSVGAYFRLDWGDFSANVIDVRNMHFISQ